MSRPISAVLNAASERIDLVIPAEAMSWGEPFRDRVWQQFSFKIILEKPYRYISSGYVLNSNQVEIDDVHEHDGLSSPRVCQFNKF